MTIQLDSQTEQQIDQSMNLLKNVLGQELLGVYLYGSSIGGGLQKFSDIDLFVVINRPTTVEEKNKIATGMLSISGVYMRSTKRPIEVIIVVKAAVNPWPYPPTFDFQYGEWLRNTFEKGDFDPWESREMSDLAILITQVLLASKTLFGPEPNTLFNQVPYKDFLTATVKELDNLMANLGPDTRNVLLTFARMWSTVATDTIYSKPDAAMWVIKRLPLHYQPVMQRALAIHLGEKDESWKDMSETIAPCARYMAERIKEQVSLLKNSDTTTRSISIS